MPPAPESLSAILREVKVFSGAACHDEFASVVLSEFLHDIINSLDLVRQERFDGVADVFGAGETEGVPVDG